MSFSNSSPKKIQIFERLCFFPCFAVNNNNSRIQLGSQIEVDPEDINVTFNDVKGCDEAKQELHEIVEFLKNPSKFSQLGGKLPKGVLLVGPPGMQAHSLDIADCD